jgi:hypothetical protein
MTLISSELFELISEEVSSTKHGRILFISPYITTSTLIELAKQIPDERHVVVVTSWDEMNLLQGSSNLDIYPFCDSRGWELKILNNLHAKAYAVEPDVLFIGSANLTRRGLLDKEPTNHELLYKINEPSREDWYQIEEIVTKSRTVTEDLFVQYTDWLANQQELPEVPAFDPFIESTPQSLEPSLPLSIRPMRIWFFLTQMTREYHVANYVDTIEEIEIIQRDLKILGNPLGLYDIGALSEPLRLDLWLTNVKDKYFSHPTVIAICDQIGNEWMRFGAIKQIVSELFRETETDRDTITQYVQAFYQWVEELDQEETFEFGIPRHSQLIRRKQT